MIRFWQHWNFSLVLLAVYLGTFHLWLHLGTGGVIISGVAVSMVLLGISLVVALQGYFANRIDFIAHAVVILDILLESTVISLHQGYSFYACAAAFAVVIGSFRSWCLRQPAPLA